MPNGSHVLVLLAVLVLRSAPLDAATGGDSHASQPPRQSDRDGFPRVSPFEDVRWPNVGDAPEVMVAGVWHTLVSVDGVTAPQLMAFAARTWDMREVERRVEEDLGEILVRLGKTPSAEAELELMDDAGATVRVVAPMTRENRARLLAARQTRAAAAASRPIPAADVSALGAAFASALLTSHAFTAIAPEETRERIRAMSDDAREMSPSEVERWLLCTLMRTGDGHGSLSGRLPTGPYLPCAVVPVGATPVDSSTRGRFAAVRPDHSALMDEAHPYLDAIDGRPIGEWIAQASVLVADGSPQLVRRRAARLLIAPAWVDPASPLALKHAGDPVTLTLSNDVGDVSLKTIELQAVPPRPSNWPPVGRPSSRIIHHGARPVGYLRISSMDEGDAFQAAVLGALNDFAAASCIATIIDVRGNGGGRRDLIDILGPRLLAPDAAPIVYNASRPLILPDETEGQRAERMASRYLLTRDDPHWTPAERDAIDTFARTFKPTIAIPDDRFGAWHYAVVSPAPPSVPRSAGPTMVLLDAGCFSATDIFLAAMREIPGVTLVGEPSSGGSGLTRPSIIGTTDRRLVVELRLSSMLSFQPDGRPFDGVGIHPDVPVPTLPTDLVSGGTDSVLDAAMREIDHAGP